MLVQLLHSHRRHKGGAYLRIPLWNAKLATVSIHEGDERAMQFGARMPHIPTANGTYYRSTWMCVD